MRACARALLLRDPLRAADAMQLAAAIELGDGRPDRIALYTLDNRLRDAAFREGLNIAV